MKLEKTVLVPYTAEQMYKIVNQAEDYPKFLPWCDKADILMRSDTEQKATLSMSYLVLKQHFTTHNTMTPNQRIEMNLVEGPFQKLYGLWQFKAIGETGCRIDFFIDYEFSNAFLDKMIGPVFNQISRTLMDAFVEEANKRYSED